MPVRLGAIIRGGPADPCRRRPDICQMPRLHRRDGGQDRAPRMAHRQCRETIRTGKRKKRRSQTRYQSSSAVHPGRAPPHRRAPRKYLRRTRIGFRIIMRRERRHTPLRGRLDRHDTRLREPDPQTLRQGSLSRASGRRVQQGQFLRFHREGLGVQGIRRLLPGYRHVRR